MKFCENCGTQLEDNAVFCEECGTKIETIEAPSEPAQSAVNTDLGAEQVSSQNTQPKLSETCKPAKKEIKGWIVGLLLLLFSPIGQWFIWWELMILPDIVELFFICFSVILMWTKRSWKTWFKVAITVVFALWNLLVFI